MRGAEWFAGLVSAVAVAAGVIVLCRRPAALGAPSVEPRLRAFFRRRSSAMVPEAKLRAAFTRAEIDRAVAAGKLRKGVSGYWLPEAPDPGAVQVMRRAIVARDYATD